MKFKDNPQVTIQAIPHEAMSSHLNHTHIAVIPSTYSEGTSLSCLEAMASGCAVVATNVGGLCNIVLPDFNGMLIRPTKKDIIFALEKLTDDMAFAEKIATSGYETLCQSFSLKIWRERVQKVLMEAGVSD